MESVYTRMLTILMIMEILKKHSDEENRLSQANIMELLESEYSVKVERHAPKRNLDALRDFYDINFDLNCKIKCEESTRGDGPDAQIVTSQWYMDREFKNEELQLLIDVVMFAKYIPYNKYKEIVEKLKKLGGKNFRSRINLLENDEGNRQLLDTIGVLNDAMAKNKMVEFRFVVPEDKERTDAGPDGALVPHMYRVSPYQTVIVNGRYYLICAHSKGTEFMAYRIEYIKDMEILEKENRRPIREIRPYKDRFDLAEYMKGRIYMYGGACEKVEFRADKEIKSHIRDWFGSEALIRDANEKDKVLVTVDVVPQAMLYWALQFGMSVEIISPPELREQVKDAVKIMWKRYK